jgi:enterochelin esterase-like enzyme
LLVEALLVVMLIRPTDGVTSSAAATPASPDREQAMLVPLQPSDTSYSAARIESRVFHSVTLGRDMPYTIYLPEGYDSSPAVSYPVLYMLHGMSGSNQEWISYGLLTTATDLIGSGQIIPMIIVLPQGDQGYWVDQANGGSQWATYLAHDVVTDVDQHDRTLADREHRAIGGLSMGGHGALQIALNFPKVFGVVGANSPTLRTRDTLPEYFGDQAYFRTHDPVSLIASKPAVARTLKIWIDVGAQDEWEPVVRAFHEELTREGIAHEWHEYPGGHEASYWTAHAGDYLTFFSGALARP